MVKIVGKENLLLSGLETGSIKDMDQVIVRICEIRDLCIQFPELYEVWSQHYLDFKALGHGQRAMAMARGVFTSVEGRTPEQVTKLHKQAKTFYKMESGGEFSDDLSSGSGFTEAQRRELVAIVWDVVKKSRPTKKPSSWKRKFKNANSSETDQTCYYCGELGHILLGAPTRKESELYFEQ